MRSKINRRPEAYDHHSEVKPISFLLFREPMQTINTWKLFLLLINNFVTCLYTNYNVHFF